MSSHRCQVCAGHGDASRRLVCPSCTRATLYPLRIQLATSLLTKETLASRISGVVESEKDTPRELTSDHQLVAERQRCIDSTLHSSSKDEFRESKRHIETLSEQSILIEKDVISLRKQLGEKRKLLHSRKERLSHARSNFQAQRAAWQESTQSDKQDTRHASVFDHIITARIAHLHALGFWARLERHRVHRADQTIAFQYTIGGLRIPDLRDLAQLKDGDEQHLTAVLTHVSRLLHLASRYLQIRLPAELIVPHRNWPLPMIMSPLSSYIGQVSTFPYKALSSSSWRDTDDQFRSLPRPRPLFLIRSLQQLASDDSGAYSRFLEAIGTLAWNIAWLCRTQGVKVAENDWEDVCQIGRNLWVLTARATEAISEPSVGHSSTPQAVISAKSSRGRNSQAEPEHHAGAEAAYKLGLYSHGSARNYLRAGSNVGPQPGIMDVSARGWTFGSPLKILSEYRAHLMSEMAILEAVMVEAEDRKTAENGMQLLEDSAADLADKDAEEAVQDSGADAEAEYSKGTRGWLKLRNRS